MKLEKITKNFNNNSTTKTVLNAIDIELSTVGLTYILGESGSGKTSLLNIIALNDNNYEGNIIFNNQSIKDESNMKLSLIKRRHISYIKQEDNFVDTLNIYDNLKLSSLTDNKEIDDSLLINTLIQLNIPIDYLEKYSNELSAGEKQKLSIVRAILGDHEIIVADEPTASLDDKTKSEIMSILKELSKDKLIIIATHDIDLINDYEGTVYELKDGTITKDKESKTCITKYNLDNSLVKYKEKYVFKNFLRMFFDMPIRKTLILIISSVLISVISHSLIFINVNSYKAVNKLIENNEVSEIYIASKSGAAITNYDLNEFSLKFDNSSFYLLYNETSSIKNNLNNYNLNVQNTYYKYSNFSNSIAFSNELAFDTNLELLAGTYPESNNIDGSYEVLISEFHYEYFKKFDYINDKIVQKIETYEDIINKTIFVNWKTNFVIKGVYSNKTKLDKFEYLKESDQRPDYFTQGFVNELPTSLIVHKSYYSGNEEAMIMFTPVLENNKTEIKELLKDNLFKNNNYELTNREFMFYTVNEDTRILETVKFILLTVFLISLISLMIYSYYSFIFSVNKQNIGNILSLGYKRKYIFKLFNLDSVFNTIFIFLITTLVTIFMNRYYNDNIIFSASTSLPFYKYNIITFSILLLVSYLVSLIPNMFVYNIKVKREISDILSKERL